MLLQIFLHIIIMGANNMTEDAQKKFNAIKVGDVMVGRYDWDDYHNVDFYRVIGKTACGLKLQKLGKTIVSGSAQLGNVKPVMNVTEGKPFTRRVTDKGYFYERDRYSNTIYLTAIYKPEIEYGEMRLN